MNALQAIMAIIEESNNKAQNSEQNKSLLGQTIFGASEGGNQVTTGNETKSSFDESTVGAGPSIISGGSDFIKNVGEQGLKLTAKELAKKFIESKDPRNYFKNNKDGDSKNKEDMTDAEINTSFLQQLGHSLIGKDNVEIDGKTVKENKNVWGYAGESLGDLIRGKIGLDTTNSRSAATTSKMDMFREFQQMIAPGSLNGPAGGNIQTGGGQAAMQGQRPNVVQGPSGQTNPFNMSNGMRQAQQRMGGSTPGVSPDKLGITGMASNGMPQVGNPNQNQIMQSIEGAVEKQKRLAPGVVQTQVDKDTAQANLKRKVLRKDLAEFTELDSLIDRSEGGFFDRMVKGGKTKLSSLDQGTIEGAAASAHDSVRKRLRVTLVRAAGDVGNINVVEQKAAEQLIPGPFDSQKTAEIKNALLKDYSRAIDDGSETEVRRVIQKYMNTGAYEPMEFKTEAQVKRAKLNTGTVFLLNGRKAVWE